MRLLKLMNQTPSIRKYEYEYVIDPNNVPELMKKFCGEKYEPLQGPPFGPLWEFNSLSNRIHEATNSINATKAGSIYTLTRHLKGHPS